MYQAGRLTRREAAEPPVTAPVAAAEAIFDRRRRIGGRRLRSATRGTEPTERLRDGLYTTLIAADTATAKVTPA